MSYITELKRPEYSGLSPEEALDLIKSKQVATKGTASSSDISEIFLANRLLSLIEDEVNNTGSNSLLRNLCILINKRFLSESEIDFGRASNVKVVNKFFNELAVIEALDSIGSTVDQVKTAIFQSALKPSQEFPNITIREVLKVLTPEVVSTSYSNTLPINGKGNNQFLCLEVIGNVPAPTVGLIQLSNDGLDWDNLGITIPIDKSRKYYKKVLGEFIKETSQIRVMCKYNLNMVLTHEA